MEMQKNTNMAMDLCTWTDDEVELRFMDALWNLSKIFVCIAGVFDSGAVLHIKRLR